MLLVVLLDGLKDAPDVVLLFSLLLSRHYFDALVHLTHRDHLTLARALADLELRYCTLAQLALHLNRPEIGQGL